ncbi:hypothetical protein N602_31555 [Mycobacterium avium subsp. hominissuis 10-5606]|nr:hypothetical protein N602_31555 [Mycobacterium avium subsp. hominissuis 10-5606]
MAYGKPLDERTYDASRMIAEPYRLFDCSRENDAAAAVVLTSAERAAHLTDRPAYLLGAAFGSGPRWASWTPITIPSAVAVSVKSLRGCGSKVAMVQAMSTSHRCT